jgi:hypothetical protein
MRGGIGEQGANPLRDLGAARLAREHDVATVGIA